MSDSQFISIRIEGINVTQNESMDLPNTVSIHSIYIREYTLWAVPMLDFVLIDPANVLTNSTQHNLSKGAKVWTSLSNIKEKSFLDTLLNNSSSVKYVDTSKDLTFVIASIRPRQVNSMVTIYSVSCFLESNLLYSKDSWSYTGKMSNSIYDMLNPSAPREILDANTIPQFITNIDPSTDKVARFTKPNNMTYARFLRNTILPSLADPNNKNHFMYYHSGHNVFLYNINLLMDEYLSLSDLDTSSYFVLDETKIIRTQVHLGSYSTEQKNITNGGTAYQYDADVGDYTSTNIGQATTVKHSLINDSLQDNRAVVAGVSSGNHSDGYLNSHLNSIRSNSLYNHIITVEINFIAPVNGLDILIYRTKSGESIPYLVIGKSTIFRNNIIEQHLRLATNSKPGVNSANSIGTYNISAPATNVTSSKSYSSAIYPILRNGKSYNAHVDVTYSDSTNKSPEGGIVLIVDSTGATVSYRMLPDSCNTQSDVVSFIDGLSI